MNLCTSTDINLSLTILMIANHTDRHFSMSIKQCKVDRAPPNLCQSQTIAKARCIFQQPSNYCYSVSACPSSPVQHAAILTPTQLFGIQIGQTTEIRTSVTTTLL